MLKACVGVANAGTVKKCVRHKPSQKKKRQPLKPQSMLKAAWLLAKKPAALDLSKLPAGYGFQIELKTTDTTENKVKPILDKVELSFAKQ
jgi:hypothetical protein